MCSSVQVVALASQNLTVPSLSEEEPEVTVAVSEIAVPSVTEFVGADEFPDVIASVVVVDACEASADGRHVQARAENANSAAALFSAGLETSLGTKESIQITSYLLGNDWCRA